MSGSKLKVSVYNKFQNCPVTHYTHLCVHTNTCEHTHIDAHALERAKSMVEREGCTEQSTQLAAVQLRDAPQENLSAPCGVQGCEDGAVLRLFAPEFPVVLTQQMNG